jgi:large subunit ribosomal protein L13
VEIQRRWLVVDAEGKTLGRLATQVAMVLRGKHKPTYTPHIDTGDHVVVVNAAKVVLSGRKAEDKRYFHHTLYPGGATWTSIVELMAKHPERVVERAIRGMMPRTKLGRAMMTKLKVYAGATHPHAAQQPETWALETR